MREVLVLGILIAGLWGQEGRAARTQISGAVTHAQMPGAAVPARASGAANPVLGGSIPRSGDCRALVKELRSFQNAQSSLMRGFVQKNETLAETLDLYSQQFQRRQGALKKGDYASLRQSADAFRAHGQREANLVGRFETSSGALLDQVARCLESTGPSLSLAPVHQ